MWLLKTEVAQAMREARRLGYEPTAQERDEFAVAMREAYASKSASVPRNMKVAGNTAQIEIDGVLTEKPDCFSLLFGGGNTTYASIREALAVADADPAVSSIVLKVSSPGGQVTGLFETLAALEATKKPISSIASLAASAAYAIVAVAGPVRAATPASEFGSIGVATSIFVEDDVVDIASTEAPNKRPDVKTEEGLAVVRQELDAIHEVFADAIASGRSNTTGKDYTAETVNAQFGRGSVLLAAEAKKRGMIDKLTAQPARARKGASAEDHDEAQPAPVNKDASAASGAQTEKKQMDLATFKANHPELYAAAVKEGQDKGVTLERDRVCAHLTLGEQCGDMKLATEAITSGAEMTNTITAKYLAAGMNRADQKRRQADSDVVTVATSGATAPTAVGGTTATGANGDLGDQVVSELEKTGLGKKKVA